MRIERLVLSLILITLAAVAATPPGLPDGWSEGYVYANGIRIHYYRAVPAPGKPVIVMAHGSTDYGLNWTTLTEDMQSDYEIYMVDARGHGFTDPPIAGQQGDVAVEDLVGFLREMEMDKPILMGHSMGAATVMRLGATYPDLAKAIIMLDPGLGTRSNRAPATQEEQDARIASWIERNNRSYDDLLKECGEIVPMWDKRDCEFWAISKQVYHGAYAPDERPEGMSRVEALGKISAPALVLKADATPEVRAANVEAAKVIQNGKLVHIDGAGHNLHHDKRPETVAVLNEFLGSL